MVEFLSQYHCFCKNFQDEGFVQYWSLHQRISFVDATDLWSVLKSLQLDWRAGLMVFVTDKMFSRDTICFMFLPKSCPIKPQRVLV